MLPPIDVTADSAYQNAGASERVLVKIEHSPVHHFARYLYNSQSWSVEMATGDIKVLEWWAIPRGTGNQPDSHVPSRDRAATQRFTFVTS